MGNSGMERSVIWRHCSGTLQISGEAQYTIQLNLFLTFKRLWIIEESAGLHKGRWIALG